MVTKLGVEPKLFWFKARRVANYTTLYYGQGKENRTPDTTVTGWRINRYTIPRNGQKGRSRTFNR